MKRGIVSLLAICNFILINSQITFERKFRPLDGYSVWSTLQTGDSGYVFTGRVDDSLFIGGLNKYGKLKWFKTFIGDGSIACTGRYMIRTSDKCFVVSGDYGLNSYWQFFIIKFDSTGAIKFQKHYSRGDDVKGVSLVEGTDGYIIIGNSQDASYNYHINILKINKTTGDSITCKSYTDTDYMKFFEIKKLKDNNYVMVGARYDSVCLMKINNNGDSLWSKRYHAYYTGYTFAQAADNGYIVGTDGLVFKTKADGTEDWVKYQEDWGFGTYYWANFNEIIPTYDGNYVVAGSWDPSYPWAFLQKFSPAGDSIWQQQYYDNISWTEALFVQQTTDSGFVISGDQFDTSEYNFSFMYLDVIKTDKYGEVYQIDTPNICLVTLDEKTEQNKIIWEKQNTKGIEKYIINRKEGLKWSPIGTRPFDSLSVFIDKTSSPKNYHYQYSISAINYNSDTAARSPFIETILLQASPGTSGNVANLSWNPYLDESGKFIPEYYFIYRGKSKTSFTKIDSISGDTKNPSYNDTKYDGSITYYQVGFKKDPSCAPLVLKAEGGPYSQSLSNIVEYKKVKLCAVNEIPASAYPNPCTSSLTIEYTLDDPDKTIIEIINAAGQKVAVFDNPAIAGQNSIIANTADYPSGMYSIKIISGGKISVITINKQ